MNAEHLIEQALSRLVDLGDPSRMLSRVVRPAFVAPKGKTLVWGDWSAIEARVLPWLANSRGSNKVLTVFDGNDNDRRKPDIYIIEYANLCGGDPQEIWDRYLDKDPEAKAGRQEGKVSVLSLGFGGSVGALQRMAVDYGVYYGDNRARQVVDTWRSNNLWARVYWDDLWEAALGAFSNPDTIYEAGRNAYVFDKTYLGGTLFAALPNGDLLTYPRMKWRKVEKENPYTGKLEEKNTLSCRKGYGWKGLWYGTFAENNTQATAGRLLRHKLVEIRDWRTVVGHTHDEIINEIDESEAEAFKDRLHNAMVANPPWMEGCPLAAEVTSHWYYTKVVD